MRFDQYHELPIEPSPEARAFARMIASPVEEAEAFGWHEQRISVEQVAQAKAILANAQKEEFKHFGMKLEFFLRREREWRAELQSILFQVGDTVALDEKAEKAAS